MALRLVQLMIKSSLTNKSQLQPEQILRVSITDFNDSKTASCCTEIRIKKHVQIQTEHSETRKIKIS